LKTSFVKLLAYAAKYVVNSLSNTVSYSKGNCHLMQLSFLLGASGIVGCFLNICSTHLSIMFSEHLGKRIDCAHILVRMGIHLGHLLISICFKVSFNKLINRPFKRLAPSRYHKTLTYRCMSLTYYSDAILITMH
jgi:hypothetical protein